MSILFPGRWELSELRVVCEQMRRRFAGGRYPYLATPRFLYDAKLDAMPCAAASVSFTAVSSVARAA